MTNIDFFNRFTLVLFAKLYESFPTPIDVKTAEVAAEVIPLDVEHAKGWDWFVAADHAVGFLAQEGFLTYENSYLEGGHYVQVRLTAKGLAVLGSTPDALNPRTPLIDKAKAALASGAKEAGNETIKQVMQWIVGAGIAAGTAALKT
jgi:hypothetical protein